MIDGGLIRCRDLGASVTPPSIVRSSRQQVPREVNTASIQRCPDGEALWLGADWGMRYLSQRTRYLSLLNSGYEYYSQESGDYVPAWLHSLKSVLLPNLG